MHCDGKLKLRSQNTSYYLVEVVTECMLKCMYVLIIMYPYIISLRRAIWDNIISLTLPLFIEVSIQSKDSCHMFNISYIGDNG